MRKSEYIDTKQMLLMDKRMRKRVPVTDRVICFRFHDVEGLLKTNELPLCMGMKDISFGGIGVFSNRKCDAGEKLFINLAIGEEKMEFELEARWCNGNWDQYEVGFMFNRLTENKVRYVNRYIHQIAMNKKIS